MKNLYLLFLFVFSPLIHAQIVEIPDPAFKNKLLTYPESIDVDADGEIQVEEALAVTELNFSFCSFDNITGIQAFANLESLNFGSYSSVAQPIDLSGMTSLKALRFTKCSFSTLNLEGLTGLENLSIGYAGNITFLNFEDAVNLKTIYFYSTHFTSIDLSHATGLRTFSAQHTDLDTINLSGLNSLESFRCEHPGNITELNLTDLTALKEFELEGTSLNSLDFQNNTLLEEIDCHENQLASINVSGLTALRELSCNVNQLLALDLSSNPNLEWLSCGENQLANLDLSAQHRLEYVDASYNLFTTLDFSKLTECIHYDAQPEYHINDNPNLTWVNLKNGRKDFVWTNSALNCPNLTYLCLDEEDYSDQRQMLEANGIDSIEINTYCSFVPGGNYNTIAGTFRLDLDNNGCDTQDAFFPNAKLSLTHHDQNQTTTTDGEGNYAFYTKNGDYTLTPKLENPYFIVSPTTATLHFDANNNSTQSQSFCVVPDGIHNDVEVTMIPLKNAQPGSDAYYRLVYKNKGNQMLSGQIRLDYDGSVLELIAANPVVDVQDENQLRWQYTDLKPFETRRIDLILSVHSSLETPAVVLGQVLHFDANIEPGMGDETPEDNRFGFEQTVTGAATAADKICLEGEAVTEDRVGDYVHYMIRFQNTGDSTAANVVVKDLINTDQFQMETLQVIAASNTPQVKISDNKVEFIFEGINLSSVSENEPTSSGFVAFKIKIKDTLSTDDTIANQASVYFDHLFPVQTNTATSTIIELLANTGFDTIQTSVTPNPAKDRVQVVSQSNITSLQLFDSQGRILQTELVNRPRANFDISERSSGIYFLKINTLDGSKVEKIVKE